MDNIAIYRKSMDRKKVFEKFDDKNAFIKVSAPAPVEGSQKAALNRKGNQKFNEGDIEGARRIFITTGYTDGLVRVGDYYKSKGKPLDALKMYWIAPDRSKAEPIIVQLSDIIKTMISNEEEGSNEY